MLPNNNRLPPLTRNSGVKKPGTNVVLNMLSAKLGELDREHNEEAYIVPVQSLAPNPDQPRRFRDEEKDRELAADIAARGILEPILVRSIAEGRYQIVAGERRYRAALAAGLEKVPVVIKNYDDEQARYASMVENLQRQDLDPQDEGRYYDYLNIDENIPVRAIAEYIHRSHSYVQERLNRYREQAALPEAPVEETPQDNSEQIHKRNKKIHKLQKSQTDKVMAAKPLARFRVFLEEVSPVLPELKQEEREELAGHLRELRAQLEALENEIHKMQ